MANTVESVTHVVIGADTHTDFDRGYVPAFAEIASLFEDIQADLRIITDRGNDRSKGIYQRKADTVANNPANIAEAARDYVNLQQSGLLELVNAEVGNPTNLGNTSSANYNALRNSTTSSNGFVGGNQYTRQNPGYGGASTAITGADGNSYYEGSVPLSQVPPASGTGTGQVSYSLGGVRNLPIQKQLFDIIQTAAKNSGVNVVIFSGGQVPFSEGGRDGRNRTGSNRHDKGFGADVHLFNAGSSARLTTNNQADLPIMIKFTQACKAAGATGIGFGGGYMGNTGIHVDIAWLGQKQGLIGGILSNRYWGGTPINTVNAPQYLKDLMAPRDNA